MEHCQEMISIKDTDFRYLDCNKAFLNHFGFKSKEEVVGKTIFEVIPEKNLYFVKEHLEKALAIGAPQSYSFKIKTNSPSLKFVQQTSTPIMSEGKITFILSISRDTTEDELLKAEILTKNSQLNTLLEHLPMLVYMKDKDLNYIVGSKYAKDFVTCGNDHYANNIQIDMEAASGETSEEDNYVLHNKKILVKEKVAKGLDEKQHWYKILKAPIFKDDNQINGLVTIAQNIDQYKALENQKDLFIATLVHDLKNPLLAQISSMELFNRGVFGELNDSQKEMMDITLESAYYLKEMLYTLINTYKYDNGNVKLQKESINIEDLIKTCLKENSSLAQKHSVTLDYKSLLKGDEKFIVIDKTQLRRVFSNLLNNGINYAYKDTTFEIVIEKSEGEICIAFENEGPPMDENTRKNIFEKYISEANKYQCVGFGLGMYLSKKVVEAHDGRITLECNGNYNKFIIHLPMTSNNKKKHIVWE